ncbi:MAG: glycosyltransferase, partial [Actinomycetota bacterium]|nr:glycosyltransferase [Actinomycetota bacterium]
MPGPDAGAGIVVVSPTFHPEKVGTPHYVTDLALALADTGFDVAVVTNQPYYPEFHRFEGYGRRRRVDSLGAVRIRRLPTLVPFRGAPVLRAVSEANMLLQGVVGALAGRLPRSRTVIAVSPGVPFAVLVARILRRRGGRLLVVVHDIQAGLVTATTGPAGRVAGRVAGTVEAWALNRADVIAPLSEAMGQTLSRMGVRAPIRPVPLWATVEPGLRPLPAGDRRVVMYSGNLGRKQGVSTLVDLAAAMSA